MTRFARAKGSKASNERVPQEATSWQVMKQQLEQKKQDVLDAKKHKEFENIRKANYKAFLDERENDVKMEWTEFEDASTNRDKNVSLTNKKKKKIKTESKSDDNKPKLQTLISEIENVLDNNNAEESKVCKIKRNKLKKKTVPIESIQNNDDNDDDAPDETNAKIVPIQNKVNKKLPKEEPIASINNFIDKQIKHDTLSKHKGILNTVSDKKSLKKDKTKQTSKMNDSEFNPKVENQEKQIEDMSADQIKRFAKKRGKKMRQLAKRKQFKAERREKALQEEQNKNTNKRKLPKVRDDQEHKRRKPDSQITTMNINGVDIEIDYYDGFPVKKEDAERLRKLRREMISKSIPRNEVQIALKLERRKAEKALAREKKRVCFNCRKSGHVLSECPDLNGSSSQEIIGTGICFKCGSTEHTHFDCKVIRNDAFKFATCFICREQGHISRQCPDNQKGLYPKGGACKVCGDVTHLKKDCPKFQAEQESQTIKLDTLEFNNVESLSEEKQTTVVTHKKTNSKVIKF